MFIQVLFYEYLSIFAQTINLLFLITLMLTWNNLDEFEDEAVELYNEEAHICFMETSKVGSKS